MAAPDPAATHAAAVHGTSGSASTLPHFDAIQRAFGRHDVSGVQAHTDATAAEGARAMGARGFATGNAVAFDGAPDLHTAAHEAAHVVQQRAGVHLAGGVGAAGDEHERHADAVADEVVAGRSAAGLLDRYAQPGGAGSGGAGDVQRVVGEGLSAATKVKNKKGEICLVIKAIPGGYLVANTIAKGPPVQLKYDELDPHVADQAEPADAMKKLFADNGNRAPQQRMQQATAYIDGLLSKAAASVVTAVPWVQSYSWLALGSYGRREMCPYSDVELGLVYLIKPEQRSHADARAISDKFAEIGKQVMERLKALASFVALDAEGNYPSGKGGAGLTGEASALPNSIAVARADEAMDARHTMLMDARYVPVAAAGAGREAHDAFKTAMSSKLAEKVSGGEATQADISARHLAGLAMQALGDGLADYKKRPRFVNVKKNFRQPLDWALMALCVKHRLVNAVGFEDRIAALVGAKVLPSALAGAVMDLYKRLFDARIALHQAHGKEQDALLHDPDGKDTVGYSEMDAKQIGEHSPGGLSEALGVRFAEVAGPLQEIVAALLKDRAPAPKDKPSSTEDGEPPPGHWYDGH